MPRYRLNSYLIGMFCLLMLPAVALPSASVSAEEMQRVKVIDVAYGEQLIVRDQKGQRLSIMLASVAVPRLNQPQGKRAADFVSRAILDRDIEIRKPTAEEDSRPDRWQIVLDGETLQEQMVSNGLAWVDFRYSKDEDLKDAQETAKARKMGLWIDPKARPPWEMVASDARNTRMLMEIRANGGSARFRGTRFNARR